jgi:hypothetical protein
MTGVIRTTASPPRQAAPVPAGSGRRWGTRPRQASDDRCGCSHSLQNNILQGVAAGQTASQPSTLCQLVKLTGCGRLHAAFPIPLHFARGRCKGASCAWGSCANGKDPYHLLHRGASCGWPLPTTPLLRVVRHGASLPEGWDSQLRTPRAGHGRRRDSRRGARIRVAPHALHAQHADVGRPHGRRSPSRQSGERG